MFHLTLTTLVESFHLCCLSNVKQEQCSLMRTLNGMQPLCYTYKLELLKYLLLKY